MNRIFILASFFITSISFAQISEDVNKGAAGEIPNLMKIGSGSGVGGGTMTFFNPPRKVDGTEYLFDEWTNFAVIYTEDNQRFALRNINLNIKQNAFVSKVEGDSLFTFSFNNIEKVQINGKTYKNYYWNDDNRVYEIIYEGKDFSIIKGFKIVEVVGSANPMLNRSRDRLIRKWFYYIKDDKGIHYFKLTKGKVLKALNLPEFEESKLLAYAKQNNLSFKDEDDLRKILEFDISN
ncbi:MAG: hypothetical protein R2785_01495 [Flavobacteriaceae bacterium]